MPAHVTPQQLKALLDSAQAYALIDVRERGEFNQRQIFGATSLPRRDLEFHTARLVPVKGTPVVVCDEGGLYAWAGVGLPLEQGMGGYVGQPDDIVALTYGDRARTEYYLAWEEALGRTYEEAG
jgi:hypothetical protein